MRGSHAKSEPQTLTDWLAQENADWQPQYPFPGDVRRPVVDALAEAQRELCVYCGRKLDLSAPGKSYHIEHFRPISTCPDHEVSLANIFLSCGQETEPGNRSETCGTAKANWFDESLHVEPDYPECTDRFRFSLTGHVTVASNDDGAARTMIEKLNLNHPELTREREEIQFAIDGPEEVALGYADFIDPVHGTVQSYAHMACQRFGTLIP